MNLHYFLLSILSVNIVVGQSPQEMQKFVLKANREESYWPDLSCIPHGFTYDRAELEKLKDSKQLLDAGIRSMYMLEKITQTCDKILQKNKKKVDTEFKRDACRKHCILRELGVLAQPLTKLISLGDREVAKLNFANLLTATLQPDVRNFSSELAAEALVYHIFGHIRAHLGYYWERHGSEISPCLNPDAFWQLTRKAVTDYTGNACAGFGFPQLTEWMGFRGSYYYDAKEAAKKEWKEWPDTSCINRRFQPSNRIKKQPKKPTATPSDLDLELYAINQHCRDKFYLPTLKTEFGEDTPETCTKLCVLEQLFFLNFTTDEYEDYQVGILDRKYHLGSTNFEANWHHITGLVPKWNGTKNFYSETGKLGKKLQTVINESFAEYELGDGADCLETGKWEPLLEDVDTFFVDECNNCKECNSAPLVTGVFRPKAKSVKGIPLLTALLGTGKKDWDKGE